MLSVPGTPQPAIGSPPPLQRRGSSPGKSSFASRTDTAEVRSEETFGMSLLQPVAISPSLISHHQLGHHLGLSILQWKWVPDCRVSACIAHLLGHLLTKSLVLLVFILYYFSLFCLHKEFVATVIKTSLYARNKKQQNTSALPSASSPRMKLTGPVLGAACSFRPPEGLCVLSRVSTMLGAAIPLG